MDNQVRPAEGDLRKLQLLEFDIMPMTSHTF